MATNRRRGKRETRTQARIEDDVARCFSADAVRTMVARYAAGGVQVDPTRYPRVHALLEALHPVYKTTGGRGPRWRSACALIRDTVRQNHMERLRAVRAEHVAPRPSRAARAWLRRQLDGLGGGKEG